MAGRPTAQARSNPPLGATAALSGKIRPSAAGPNPNCAASTPLASARSKGIRVALSRDAGASSFEINVIGQTVEEATDAVEKFLDHAFLDGLPRVRVVHGSGMGVLRKALRAFLQRHPHVASVQEPGQNEGGAGVTIVELRQ